VTEFHVSKQGALLTSSPVSLDDNVNDDDVDDDNVNDDDDDFR